MLTNCGADFFSRLLKWTCCDSYLLSANWAFCVQFNSVHIPKFYQQGSVFLVTYSEMVVDKPHIMLTSVLSWYSTKLIQFFFLDFLISHQNQYSSRRLKNITAENLRFSFFNLNILPVIDETLNYSFHKQRTNNMFVSFLDTFVYCKIHEDISHKIRKCPCFLI
jgi:hypothetical protein